MKKRLSNLIISCFLLTSCSTQQVVPNPANSPSNTNVSTTSTNQAGFEKSEINGIKFKKADPIAQANTGNTATVNSPAPSVAPQAGSAASMGEASKSASMVSGDVASGRYFAPYYGGNSFEEYVITDFEEGVTAGFSGSYLDAYKKIVQPVVKEWASDTRLVNVTGSTDDKGNNKNLNTQPNQPYYYDQYRWSLTFASASKKEVYTFYIGEKETYISRQKWGLKNLVAENITIDSTKAIEIYKEKVADKTFNNPNEQNYYKGLNSELLYTVPEGGTWSFYLQQEKDTLVWNVNVYFPTKYENQPVTIASSTPTATASPQSPVFQKPQPVINISYSGGYAKIDAKTGKVIDMSRIIKYTNTVYPYPCPNGYCPEYVSGVATAEKAL